MALCLGVSLLTLVIGCEAQDPDHSAKLEASRGENAATDAFIEDVRRRAEERWGALADQNLAAAYGFESPGYRGTVSEAQFRSRFGSAVRWRDFRVDEVRVIEPGQVAEVRGVLTYEAPDPLGNLYQASRPLTERWVRSEDEWWYVRD